METESVQVKPEREPDFITKKGTYIWFDEMLYLSATTSALLPMCIDEETGLLRRVKVGRCSAHRKSAMCDACLYGKRCIRPLFGADIQEAYNAWHVKSFESIVLGANDDA